MTCYLRLMLAFYLTSAYASDLSTKRGLAFHGDKHKNDNDLLLSHNSTIAWYYTWSVWPSEDVGDSVPFVPLVHGLEEASDSKLASQLNDLPTSSTRLLTFNEPDGKTDTGGSAISPKDAATAYMSYIAPLRKSNDSDSREWLTSWPSVTGSSRGIDWLRDFNESCYDIDDKGCPMDFVAVHWYGDFSGLKSWLETLRDFYNQTAPDAQYWVTEMALPKQDSQATLSMMNDSLSYLDDLEFVQAYAWFGVFRNNEANEWTGDNVSLFNDDGDLTDLGALYLGGKERGFTKGMSQGPQQLPSRLLYAGVFFLAFIWLQT